MTIDERLEQIEARLEQLQHAVDADLDRLADIPEAARRMGVSIRTGYRLAEAGHLLGVPIVIVAGKQKVPLRRLVEAMTGVR